MTRFFAGCIAVLISLAFVADNKTYPKDYFALPLNRSIKLSGTFGELRSNHFHAGIDIKTLNGQPGEQILAAAEGYVARIKVQPAGYGRALYIAHPNGYTTVYAHLDRFSTEIEAYVKEQQYAFEQFSVDLYPSENRFYVQQGDHIGYLGNSGSSFGPHLHFEIRKTAGQVPVNPLHFGLFVDDNIPPQMRALKVYYLNGDHERVYEKRYPLLAIANNRFALRDTLSEGAWRVAFGLKVDDRVNGATNRNGIYSLEYAVEDTLRYAFRMDDIPFSHTRYLNSHIDYRARKDGQGYYHLCHRLPGNALDIYTFEHADGPLPLYHNKPQKVVLTVSDYNGNASELAFYIRRDTAMSIPSQRQFTHPVQYTQAYTLRAPDLTMSFDGGTFYENTYLNLVSTAQIEPGELAPRHAISPNDIPMHKYAELTIRNINVPSGLEEKAFVAVREDNGRLTSYGGTVSGSQIHTSVRELGTYTVALDTIPPTIRAQRFSTNMTGYSSMYFAIRDNQRTRGRAHDLRYSATVDGKWILMEYDAKSDRITHYFDGRIPAGRHTLKIVVTDDRNNSATLEREFTL